MSSLSLVDTATPRVCLVAITKHGAAQAVRLAADLPGADICTSAKFAAQFSGLPNAMRATTARCATRSARCSKATTRSFSSYR